MSETPFNEEEHELEPGIKWVGEIGDRAAERRVRGRREERRVGGVGATMATAVWHRAEASTRGFALYGTSFISFLPIRAIVRVGVDGTSTIGVTNAGGYAKGQVLAAVDIPEGVLDAIDPGQLLESKEMIIVAWKYERDEAPPFTFQWVPPETFGPQSLWYVGWGDDKIALFVGKDMVARDVPTAEADERLVELIKEHGRWVDPPVPAAEDA